MSEQNYLERLKNTGRNDACPCGSGKKYKKCHLPQDEAKKHEEYLKQEEELKKANEAKQENDEKKTKEHKDDKIKHAAMNTPSHPKSSPKTKLAKSNIPRRSAV